MPRPDDDALSWHGDDDPTLDTGAPSPVAQPAADPIPDSDAMPPVTDAEAAEAIRPGGERTSDVRAPMGSAALVALGVVGGIHALYVVGWVIGGLRLSGVTDFLISASGEPPLTWSSGNLVGVWLAAAAPALWFVTVLLLTREARGWIRWVWLSAGVIVLIPWPLLMIGAAQ